MKYGFVSEVRVLDDGRTEQERSLVSVTVEFLVSRDVLFEFMDALRPINQEARREPIQAILDGSAYTELAE